MLVGKRAQDIKIVLIENATEPYPEGQSWIDGNLIALKSFGFEVELVDLKKNKTQLVKLESILAASDVIWLGGGNAFYLRWILKDVGADKIITKLVKQGYVLGGDSAGAIVAGPTLKYFDSADDPKDAPGVVIDGLRLTDQVVVPHMDNEKFASVIHGINDRLRADGYETVPINDGQALVINGDITKII